MLLPIFCTPEDHVDFEIEIGLLSKDDRQFVIDKLYKEAYEILSQMVNDTFQNTYE